MQFFPKIIIASNIIFAGLHTQTLFAQAKVMDNPLLQRSTLQYQAPPFNLIKDEHFKPAFEEGFKKPRCRNR